MGNDITFVPSAIGNLQSLRRLALDYNRVTMDGIPETLFQDTALERITLTGNPITQAEFARLPGVETFMKRRLRAKNREVVFSDVGGLERFSLCGLD